MIPNDILAECRQRLGPAPRRYSWYDRATYLFTARPPWVKKDPLNLFFENRQLLLREGIVVWGHIIQANMAMFRRDDSVTGGPNCPGEVVYCPDPSQSVSPAALRDIAHALFRLKGTTPDDDALRFFASYLANERIRVFGKPVPPSLSPNFPCRVSTVFFERDHLPGERLGNTYFPLLISAGEPHVAMPLPSRYWPPVFTAEWAHFQ